MGHRTGPHPWTNNNDFEAPLPTRSALYLLAGPHTHACELWSTVCVIRIKKYKGTEPYLWLAIHVLFLASDTVVFVTSDEGEKK